MPSIKVYVLKGTTQVRELWKEEQAESFRQFYCTLSFIFILNKSKYKTFLLLLVCIFLLSCVHLNKGPLCGIGWCLVFSTLHNYTFMCSPVQAHNKVWQIQTKQLTQWCLNRSLHVHTQRLQNNDRGIKSGKIKGLYIWKASKSYQKYLNSILHRFLPTDFIETLRTIQKTGSNIKNLIMKPQ